MPRGHGSVTCQFASFSPCLRKIISGHFIPVTAFVDCSVSKNRAQIAPFPKYSPLRRSLTLLYKDQREFPPSGKCFSDRKSAGCPVHSVHAVHRLSPPSPPGRQGAGPRRDSTEHVARQSSASRFTGRA